MKQKFQVIAFDADDTLWVNETYFRASEHAFCKMMGAFMEPDLVQRVLFRTEVRNMELYGYGIKAFILSMMETALEVSQNKLDGALMEQIVLLGKDQLNKEVVLLDGVENVLQNLAEREQKVVVVTKGDLLDQERKLHKSGLDRYFHHVEIVSEKHEENYLRLIEHLAVAPHEFLMVGNSVKSDVVPVLNIGAHALHIPFHETWEFEKTETEIRHERFAELNTISELIPWLER